MNFIYKHDKKILSIVLILGLLYAFCLPRPLFKSPVSPVLQDKNGELLGAAIAADGQYRFPEVQTIPDKFKHSILEFEDRRFYSHPGFDPVGFARAMEQNIRNGRVVSGGSTITMQVIRMSKGNQDRNLLNKIIEAITATRLELSYSKEEILKLYATHAPFGGNVVGLETAAWRYYGKKPELLSWGEAATLAVLPNSPALIHPGRNRTALFEKRNRLLDRLHQNGTLDSLTCQLAKEEPLPGKPLPLPRLAPHLLDRMYSEANRNQMKNLRFDCTVDRRLQSRANQVFSRHKKRLLGNGIHNAAAIIIEVETGNVVAYIGNIPNAGQDHAESVDIITAPRSTGSILKPFLYGLSLDEGATMPQGLLPDVPTQMGSYRPENYYESYDGAVPADRSIIRSLNVPTVRLLQRYGIHKFKEKLNDMGIHSIHQPADHYGLTLILGGAEGNLEQITNAYAGMARTVNHFLEQDGLYAAGEFRQPNFNLEKEHQQPARKTWTDFPPVMSASAAWHTFQTIRHVERPTEEGNWEIFESENPIAWKTGTSFGFRDAWAVGVTPQYAVGVWVGNADGEGRPGLIGVKAAAPILFDLYDLLPSGNWFDYPVDEMKPYEICRASGFIASHTCGVKDTLMAPPGGIKSKACPFHQFIHVDDSGQRVNVSCSSPNVMERKSWFVLPPLEEFYYKSKNPGYKVLPPKRVDCDFDTETRNNPMQMIYPKFATKIYVPIGHDGKRSKSVFKVAHRRPDTKIFWHLDRTYLGETQTFHEMQLDPEYGEHTLVLVDEKGNRLEQQFTVLKKERK